MKASTFGMIAFVGFVLAVGGLLALIVYALGAAVAGAMP